MRVDHLKEVLRKPGKLGVELKLHARGKKGEAFQKTLDVRIGAFEAVERVVWPFGDDWPVAGSGFLVTATAPV